MTTSSSKNDNEIIFSEDDEKLYCNASKQYERGDYEWALKLFNKLKTKYSADKESSTTHPLNFYIDFCKNVIKTNPSAEDLSYLEARKVYKKLLWLWLPASYLFYISSTPMRNDLSNYPDLMSLFLAILITIIISIATPDRAKHQELRCKWCGHYTPYIGPDGFSFTNKCFICDRSYPMPSVMWDRIYTLEAGK